VWQAIHEELESRGLVVISVALDSGGARTTEQWIRAASPT
jgi:hypothetical protein